VPDPVVLDVRLTALPETEAETEALESPLIADASPEAIDEFVVPDPLQFAKSPCELTVSVQDPESYTVVYTASLPPVSVEPEAVAVMCVPPVTAAPKE
jgi:hypothetical protein